jgi:flavin-dependent dehydrogenase
MLDALVIGGGPAGSTVAALLAKAGWGVAVAEKQAFPRDKVCGGYLGPSAWPVLDTLGLSEAVAAIAGPPIGRVGFFAGDSTFSAAMPHAPYGRALCRRDLDALLIARARHFGATLHQPCQVIALERASQGYVCHARAADGEMIALGARQVIAAHGAWLPGGLPTQLRRQIPRPGDLLAFKTEFRDARLSADLMPLLAFRGGYGGMVQASGGRVTLSFCVRRDALERSRALHRALPAGEAALRDMTEQCRGLREALAGAVREGAWLAAGPIRPGVRAFHHADVFVLGNAVGEAHPAIAEGIAMALESAALLAGLLLSEQHAARVYERRWRARFGRQVLASRLVAAAAMHASAMDLSRLLIGASPRILSFCAGLAGKA